MNPTTTHYSKTVIFPHTYTEWNTPELYEIAKAIFSASMSKEVYALSTVFKANGSQIYDARDEPHFLANTKHTKEFSAASRAFSKGDKVEITIPKFSVIKTVDGEPLIRRFQVYTEGPHIGYFYDIISKDGILETEFK